MAEIKDRCDIADKLSGNCSHFPDETAKFPMSSGNSGLKPDDRQHNKKTGLTKHLVSPVRV